MTHSRFSPSSAHRWIACPGSVNAIEEALQSGLIKEESSEYANEGTLAHEHAEQTLKYYLNRVDKLPTIDNEEMQNAVNTYCDYVFALRDIKHDVYIEERLSFNYYIQDGHGTVDAIVIDRETKTAHIIDFKYGQGVRVDAYENEQLQLYALGVLQEFEFLYDTIEQFHLHIVQPRCDNISSHIVSRETLLGFAEKAVKASHWYNNALIPTEKGCRFCPVKVHCVALHDHTYNTIADNFKNVSRETIHEKSRIQRVLKDKTLIESYLKHVYDYAKELLLKGEKIEGFKLVEGRGTRKYTEEAKVILPETLNEKAFKSPELITLTEAEKILGKKAFAQLDITYKEPGQPKIVPDDANGKEITNIIDDFAQL